MSSELFPMRWPRQWQKSSDFTRLKDTPINCLLIEDEAALRSVADEAVRNGFRVFHGTSEASGITLINGDWPGIRMSRSRDRDEASSGPTGMPWVDSNGWKVRLAAALNPRSTVWVAVPLQDPLPGPYSLCFADIAACGGRWIITLEDKLAAAIDDGDTRALHTWKELTRATEFFARHVYWSDYVGEAVVGVVSDFSGKNKFLSEELLNLLTRTTEQYRIIPKTGFSLFSLSDLKAVVYPDSDAPLSEIRKQVLAFVRSGGLLIAGPEWGNEGGSAMNWEHPHYTCRALGKGKIAVAKPGDAPDPYLLANDAVALISHRFDLLRFWDAGAVNAYLSVARDRKCALVQMLFYAQEMNGKVSMRGPDTATVRVAGRYRTAQLLTFDGTNQLIALRPSSDHGVGMVIQEEAVELHLPKLSHYAAVELSA